MFKHEEDKERFLHLHDLTLMVMFDMKHYAEKTKLPFMVTATLSTKEEDEKLKRTSTSHYDGRSFDMSVQGWKRSDVNGLVREMNSKYRHIAALKMHTLEPVLLVFGDERHTDHVHVQIHSRYKKKNPLEKKEEKKQAAKPASKNKAPEKEFKESKTK